MSKSASRLSSGHANVGRRASAVARCRTVERGPARVDRPVPTLAMLAICVGVLLTPASTASGQEQQAATLQDTVQAPVQPTPIAASDIPSRSESTIAQLREFSAEVSDDPILDEIRDRLPQIAAARDSLLADPRNLDMVGLTILRLEELRAAWLRLANQLDAGESLLAERSRALESSRDTLAQTRAIWQVTLDSASALDYPQAAIERVNSTLTEIADVDAALRGHLDALVTLQTRIAGQRTQVTERLAEIEGSLQVARQQLFTRNAPPLWRGVAALKDDLAVSTHIREAWSTAINTLTAYAREHEARLLLHLAGFVILFSLLIALGRRSRYDEDDDEALAGYSQILTRPASSAFLVALVVAGAVHPQAPPVAYELVPLIGVFPALRLLPRLVHPGLRRAVYFLGALVVLHELNLLLLLGTPAERIVLLMVTVFALGGLTWGLRSDLTRQPVTSRISWITKAAATVAVPILAASVTTNTLGYVALASLLTNGTLMSLFIAAVVFTVVSVLDGIVTLSLRTRAARKLNAVRDHRELINRRISALLHLAGFLVWAEPTLELYQLRDPLVSFVQSTLDQRLTVGALSITVGGVLAFAVAITLTVLISRFIRFALAEDVFPRLKLPRGVGDSISMIIHYTIIGLGILTALAAAGLEWQNFAIIAGALGIGIGFGLQNLVNNFVSGLILIFERPVQLGDTVEFGNRLGVVRRIGIRSSTVRTFDGAEVIVPNGNLIAAEVVNWTLSDRIRRLEVSVGVAYGTDPNRVIEILLEVTKDHPDVLKRPTPIGFFDGFGESSLDFSVWLWTTSLDWRRIRSETSLKIHKALSEAGIEIPFPQRDLHVKSLDEAVRREIRNDRREGEDKA